MKPTNNEALLFTQSLSLIFENSEYLELAGG